jgi:hypothetical protein
MRASCTWTTFDDSVDRSTTGLGGREGVSDSDSSSDEVVDADSSDWLNLLGPLLRNMDGLHVFLVEWDGEMVGK